MPTYLYQCKHCRAELEYNHGMNELAKPVCCKCVGSYATGTPEPMGRVIGYKPGVSLRGAGFRTNDDPSARVPK